ncbi:Tic22 family protein [Leptolyngbya sp. FACHB-711]|nr:Tic22 family protein [Leptolyngbya sp. FACHB-711]MBD1851481.1 hypothetical protein [Cyanobacteria bacterium FACHB-502]MBD2027352.1 hypothetical protein [Leptolyngbya sp. FACHB-711]
MKSVIRWSATLSLVSSVLIGSFWAGTARVLALTAEQVMERLRPVPVFTLANEQGAPLVASPTEGENRGPVAGVFINRQDAERFLNDLKTRNPQVAQGVRVVPVSLADIYQIAETERSGQTPQDQQLRFAFIPAQQQVDAAMTILREGGQTVNEFEGVPIFVAQSSGQNRGYLTIQQGNQQVIPMFFDRAELQAVLTRLQQSQPELANGMQVQVVNLEGLIQTLQASENEELNQILLVPPRDSVEFVRSLQPQGGQGQQGQQRQGQQGGQQRQAQPAQPRR